MPIINWLRRSLAEQNQQEPLETSLHIRQAGLSDKRI